VDEEDCQAIESRKHSATARATAKRTSGDKKDSRPLLNKKPSRRREAPERVTIVAASAPAAKPLTQSKNRID
jgi:hypothetical protein